jgi:phosphatidylglycerophosphate synthase
LNKPASPEIKFGFNVPHFITAARVILAVIIVWLIVLGSQSQVRAAGILLIVAACTDWLDGFLARKLGQTSLLGSIFDMIADQVLYIPCLILAIATGLFSRTNGLMPFNPYPFAMVVLAGGVAVLAGIGIFLWKRRSRAMDYPTPTIIAKVNYWFWQAPLIVAILGVGPDLLLAVLMYLAIISTILTFYSYLKKGSYVFTD